MKKSEFDKRNFFRRTVDTVYMFYSEELRALESKWDEAKGTYTALYDYFKKTGRTYSDDLLKDVIEISKSSSKYGHFTMGKALGLLENLELIYEKPDGWTLIDIEYDLLADRIRDAVETPGKKIILGLLDVYVAVDGYNLEEVSDMELQTGVKFEIEVSGSDGRTMLAFADCPFTFERPDISEEYKQSYLFGTVGEAIEYIPYLATQFLDAGQNAIDETTDGAIEELEESGEYMANGPYRSFKEAVIDNSLEDICLGLDLDSGSVAKETLDNGDIRYYVLN